MSPDAAAVLAAVGFVAIAAFQLALALGAPWGRAAWGGQTEGQLRGRLRAGSGVAAVVWLFAADLVLGRVGIVVVPVPDAVLRVGAWVLVGVLVTGFLMNLVSRSRLERGIWAPATAVLAALTFVVARSPWPPG